MIVALFGIAYFAVCLACIYVNARISDENLGPIWLIWPVVLPLMAVIEIIAAVERMGARRGR